MEGQLDLTGKYTGPDPTETEEISGTAIETARFGPLKPGGPGHLVLRMFGGGARLTAYEASMGVSGDWHAKRREVRRLMDRGFVRKDGTKPNRAPAGRPHVDAFVVTAPGLDELRRLG